MREEAKPMACSSAIIIERNGVPYRHHYGWPSQGVGPSDYPLGFEERMSYEALKRKIIKERANEL